MVDHLNIGVSTIPTDPQIPFNFLRKSDKMKSSRVEITHTKCLITRKACPSHPNPCVADIGDMLNLLEKIEGNKISVPEFFAKGFNSLPPSGFENLASLICSLRDEIAAMRTEVAQLRSSNEKDARCLDDLNHVVADVGEIKASLNQTKNLLKNKNEPKSAAVASTSTSYAHKVVHGESRKKETVKINGDRRTVSTSSVEDGTCSEPVSFGLKHDSFQPLRNKSAKNHYKKYSGKRKNISGSREVESGGLSGVERVVDVFLGGCSLDSDIDQIKRYCSSLQVTLKNIIDLESKSLYYKSFKLSINISDREQLLSEDFWPKGIFIRKFYNPRKSRNSE